MSSGVQVNEECITSFQALKSRRYKYIIYKLSDDLKEIVVDQSEGKSDQSNEEVYREFADKLDDNCRYAIFDFEFEKGDDGIRNKLVFISWSPDDAKIKQKMVYASSRDALRKALQGVHIEVQGTDKSEIDFDEVLAKCQKGY